MNQNELLAKDETGRQLLACGWKAINLYAGVAVCEYQTDIDSAGYLLFVNKKPAGIIETKRAEGIHLTVHEDPSHHYVISKPRYLNSDSLPFVYESTGELTRFNTHHKASAHSNEMTTKQKNCTRNEWCVHVGGTVVRRQRKSCGAFGFAGHFFGYFLWASKESNKQ